MDNSIYDGFFAQSSVPFVFGKIIFDDQAGLSDFELLAKNDAFTGLFQFDPADFLVSKLSQISKVTAATFKIWLETLCKSNISQKAANQNIYFDSIGKWLHISLFPISDFNFGCVVNDLSVYHQKSEIDTFQKMYNNLAEKNEQLERFFSVNLDLLCIADLDGNFIKVNKSWESILGYTVEVLENSKFLHYVHPDDLNATLEVMSRLGQDEDVLDFVNRYRCSDGSYRYIEWRSHPYDQVIYAAARDITEQVLANQALKISEEKYRLITENTSDVIWVMNMSTMKYIYISPSIQHLRGFTVEEAMAQNFEESMTPESARELIEIELKTNTMQKFLKDPEHPQLYIHEIQQSCKNGQVIWVETSTKYRLNAQNEIECVGTSRNIEDRKKIEQEILYLSYRDQLTGLYNRRFFEEEIKRLDTARNLPIAIISGDLDKLKYINDTFGHDFGDEYIVKAAQAIKASCRAEDIVSRWGGDEFVIFLPKTRQSEVEGIVDRILLNCQACQVKSIPIGISLGIGMKNTASEQLSDIMRNADIEMYKAKRKTDRI